MIYNMLYDNGPKLPILITNQLDINTNSDILNFASYQKDHNQLETCIYVICTHDDCQGGSWVMG